MLRCVQRLSRRERRQMLFSTTDGARHRVDLADILYFESSRDHVLIHTLDADLATVGTLKALEAETVGAGFVRCNNGYLVNLRHVTGIDGATCRIRGGRGCRSADPARRSSSMLWPDTSSQGHGAVSDLLLGGMDDDSRLLVAALAEWAACMVYVLVARRRTVWLPTAAIAGAGLVALTGLHLWTGSLSTLGWAFGIVLAVAVMWVLLIASLRVSVLEAGYLVAKSFVVAELAASLYWQIVWFWLGDSAAWVRVLVLACVLAAVLFAVWAIERRRMADGAGLGVTWRDMAGAAAIAALTFRRIERHADRQLPSFADVSGPVLLYVRTLVDFCGAIALFAQQEVRRELQARRDADATAQLLRNQHDQYVVSRRAMDEVNRRYHDMRHRHSMRCARKPIRPRERGCSTIWRSLCRTTATRCAPATASSTPCSPASGCAPATTASRCAASWTGRCFTLHGTARRDGAAGQRHRQRARSRAAGAEAVVGRVALFAHDDFVMLRVANSYDGTVTRSGRATRIAQSREQGHGYGLSSIRAIAQRHGYRLGGSGERWFSPHVLLPRPGV